MIQHLLAGAAVAVLMSGVAAAQTYPPGPPAPPGTTVAPAPPPARVAPPAPPVPGASPPTVTPGPTGNNREVTTHKEMDENGNSITEKHIHHEGVSGSTDTHTKIKRNPETGTTTRSTTTRGE